MRKESKVKEGLFFGWPKCMVALIHFFDIDHSKVGLLLSTKEILHRNANYSMIV